MLKKGKRKKVLEKLCELQHIKLLKRVLEKLCELHHFYNQNSSPLDFGLLEQCYDKSKN